MALTVSVSLNSITRNWKKLRDLLCSATCAAVVKADAYGCGLAPVVKALHSAGCTDYFVASVAEALALRSVLPHVRIFVLNGFLPHESAAYRTHALTPILNTPEAYSADIPDFALHIDTGMNRLGMSVAEAHALVQAGAKPSVLMSHWVMSEEPEAPLTHTQGEVFAQAYKDLKQTLPNLKASMHNSSGIFLKGEAYDIVRPGYALYGGNPTPGTDNPMEPVVTLTASVLQVRDVPAGATVGYGATWCAPEPRRLATLNIGYADGVLRTTQGFAEIRGVLCPFVGRVSMDLIVVDVTHVLPRVTIGDKADLLNTRLTVDRVAELAGTIGYEVLTSLSRRAVKGIIPTAL
jgi:alanine racemase